MSSRSLALGLALGASLLGGWFALAWLAPRLRQSAQPRADLTLLPPEDAGAATWRKHMEASYPPIPIRAFEDTTLVREVLAEPIAAKLYPVLATSGFVWSAHENFRRSPGLRMKYAWPEHPKGGWRLETNGAGLRMQDELRSTGPYLAIAGDSHVEGACSNDESAAGLLSLALDQIDGAPQVVNLACGGYSLHQYLGSLEALCGDPAGQLVDLSKRPPVEALAVVVYGGNDFQELLKLAHYWGRTDRPADWGRSNSKLKPWFQEDAPAIAQAIGSLVYFRDSPIEAELALHEALAVCEELQRHATRRGFRLVFVYLPSALTAEPELHEQRFEPILADLDISAEDLEQPVELADAFLAGLSELGCEALDLRPRLAAGPQHFWSRDLHLNLEGQAQLAELLLDWYLHPGS